MTRSPRAAVTERAETHTLGGKNRRCRARTSAANLDPSFLADRATDAVAPRCVSLSTPCGVRRPRLTEVSRATQVVKQSFIFGALPNNPNARGSLAGGQNILAKTFTSVYHQRSLPEPKRFTNSYPIPEIYYQIYRKTPGHAAIRINPFF